MYNADNYTLRNYGHMVNADARTKPLIAALKAAIVPGESIVLDIGTGIGFFSFMACRLGAKKVYAIEPDNAIEIARLSADNFEYKERIIWIQGLSTKIELPEKADVVIGDLHGTLPFYNSNISSMIDARKRHLKPGGHIISMRDRLLAVPAFAPSEYEDVDAPWFNNPYDIDFSTCGKFVVNDWWRARPDVVPVEHLLSSPRQWGEIDYRTIESPNIDGRVEWAIERAGTIHGLYVWFDGDVADGLGYSNAPDLPELLYGRAFFPMQKPVQVAVGDKVETRISATLIDNHFVYRWDTRITDVIGNIKAQYKQSTFKARPLRPDALQALSEDYCPAINEAGMIAQVVLTALEQSRSLGQIADMVAKQFPQRFSNKTAALNHVSGLLRKFSGDTSA